ncbi:DNA polymerase V [Pseudomaricurvus alkylphenolicus]|jgi:DNA polymerase V|uniref:S24 family peptidase n=1 Tax=Pseudomaricurvus alkylphenolicus TaxID=1306991 RepID=UPI001422CC50|nr:S24 family peptidase [Pseudomaricurvus alkylphenolicus]NIB39630.1 DNA polymerase V [Pseudomaricurvus alkylphenolicus]
MNVSELAPVEIRSQIALPLFLHSDTAGFGSPLDEEEPGLDLNDYLLRQPDNSFYARAKGDALLHQGIQDGDLLVIDRALKPQHGDIVVAVLDGELICRELDLRNSLLLSGDENLPPVSLGDSAELRIEGVVLHSIRQHR